MKSKGFVLGTILKRFKIAKRERFLGGEKLIY